MEQFGVKSFPTIILVSGNSQNVYNGVMHVKDAKTVFEVNYLFLFLLRFVCLGFLFLLS